MKKTIREEIISYMEENEKSSYSVQDIAKGLKLTKSDNFKLLVQTIASMERDHQVTLTGKGKVKLAARTIEIEGTFRANDKGFGFVTIDDEEPDVYISRENIGYALDGDTVLIDIIKPAVHGEEQAAEGKIVSIVKRSLTQIVGEFTEYDDDLVEETGLYGFVLPKEKKLSHYKIYITAAGIRPKEGEVCVVEVTHYPEKGYENQIEGIVKQTIGHKNDPGMDILSIAIQYGIPTEFSADVLNQAERVPEKVLEEEFDGRRDLRDELIITIDGADAKDLDDAVQVKKMANGNYLLGVHIADVTHYVTENSFLDREALDRGTSVYLTDRVIPMLPPRLSNGICSLNPHVPRLTMSCQMEINPRGRVVAYEIFESVIQSRERMTYSDVNLLIDRKEEVLLKKYQHLLEMIDHMTELHHVLAQMRVERGAISFEDREAQIYLDDEGHPLEIHLRERGTAEKLIESFMLAANETIAKHFNEQGLPFIYRVHEQPKENKMQFFFEFITNYGIKVEGLKDALDPKELQRVLNQTKDMPESPIISMMLLRSMQQARYSEESLGHFGLAAKYYTHFTSPIRRYPDLLVHRLIKAYQQQRPVSEKLKQKWQKKIPEIAAHASNAERRAVEAERETDALKKTEFMVQHVGETFDGYISSVTKFGIFVELPNTIEGLIHVSQMKDDYYQFIENHLALVGERTRKIYKIGQQVTVKVIKADVDNREIDFEILRAEKITQPELFPRKKKDRGGSRQSKNKGARNLQGREKKSQGKTGKRKKEAPFYQKAAKSKKKRKGRR
ncbi:ribonuclease R [Vagococcus elongatus]|uniref:Ribonuclease R n=1 Tax=Vagococcus elongatus TaxID=180344 RepID=A0A430AX28_9ENTE|nr:ribonuclease R [Vagococcus elongatus]RSU12627.1 ribonuclease R [Vagococcus elongatus]